MRLLLNDKSHLIICIIIIAIFSISYNPNFDMIRGGDAGSYEAVADDIKSEASTIRTPLYSLLIYLGKIIPIIEWQTFILFIYSILHGIMALIFWKLLSKEKIKTGIRYLIIIVVLLSPRIMYYKHDLSPEFLLSFLILTLFYFVHECTINKLKYNPIYTVILWGGLSALCTLAKPIWLFGILLLLPYTYYLFRATSQGPWKPTVVLLLTYIFLLMPWQIFLIVNFDQFTLSKISTRGLNLISIRAGYLNDAPDTDLYRIISQNKKLFSLAKDMKWKNYETYTEIKNNLNLSASKILLNDHAFYLNALGKNIFSFSFLQLSRIHKFYWSKYLNLLNWEIWSDSLILTYLRLYKVIYLFLVPIFFFIGIIYTFWKKDPISTIATLFILYYSFVCVFLSPHDSVLTRLRVGIDPILMSYLFVCFRHKFSNIG